MQRIFVTEVQNFGGFFGGDTVTLVAVPWPTGEEMSLTIDEKALQNISDRYLIGPEMLLDLELVGERVDRAWVLGARDWDELKRTLEHLPPAAPSDTPTLRAYRCAACDLWVLGAPAGDGHQCVICDQLLSNVT